MRKINPQHNQKLAEDALKILAESVDWDVENRLVMLLDYSKFGLIKFLLMNRLKIVWCTRLARAEDQEQRKRIEEEMMGLGPDLAAVLEQLHATRATAKEQQKELSWCRETEWLLCVSDSIVELVPSLQEFPGSHGAKTFEVMVERTRPDLYVNLPALRKLGAMLLSMLDGFQAMESWYVDRAILTGCAYEY